jgi:mannose/fructose/N-acetylgalactosamine-specific phosphotransferase system component IIC
MIENTLNWYKGEIFEGKLILLFGLVTVILALMFRLWSSTPNAKALLIPVMVAGLLFTIIGASMAFSNQKKIPTVVQSFGENKATFFESEKKRVEDFQYLYPLSMVISVICFLVAAYFLGFTKNVYLHATAIALAWIGVAFMVIDYFSKERAAIYYEQLTSN